MTRLEDRAKADETVAAQIADIEKNAEASAKEMIEDIEDVTEEKAQEIREQELEKFRAAEVAPLLKKYRYLAFEAVAAEESIPLAEIDYFRKSFFRTPAYREMEDSSEKFLKSNPKITSLDIDFVSDPLKYDLLRNYYVVRVLDRKDPDPKTMTQEDYDRERMNLFTQMRVEIRTPKSVSPSPIPSNTPIW